ncbi:MAG: hypothetical protein MR797_05895 [Lachnospiraceae bacterium]|nr:hypothetical protein [Lachnospiraceae bacterium]
MSIRTYSELITLPTFEERFRYLQLGGKVGEDTFGHDRYLNQMFYASDEWRRIRRDVIVRDNGCDLGIQDREIHGLIIIHHMNPITIEDIINRSEFLLNPEYLISTVKNTHDAIHFSDERILITDPIERKPNDTCPWKR